MKNYVFALDIAFKLDFWVQITPLTEFVPKRAETKPEVHQETRKHIDFLKKQQLHAVITSQLLLDR